MDCKRFQGRGWTVVGGPGGAGMAGERSELLDALVLSEHRYTLRNMPPPASSVRNVLVGHLGTQETFETSFWQAGIDLPGADEANDYATAVAGIISGDMGAALGSLLSNSSGYDQLRCYFYAGGSAAAYVGEAELTIGATGPSIACYQQCCVVTLLTGFAGRRNRGRMYLPANGVGVGTDGLFSTASGALQTVATAISTAFDDMNSNTTDEGSVSVVSIAGSAARPVNQVRIGDRPDIQRRRANKLDEGPGHSATVTPRS